jgi:hypothetical protein
VVVGKEGVVRDGRAVRTPGSCCSFTSDVVLETELLREFGVLTLAEAVRGRKVVVVRGVVWLGEDILDVE